MIKNIVFDLGNVLIDYDPRRIIAAVFTEKEDQDLILKEVFQSAGWLQIDQGLKSFEEYTQELAARFPQYAQEIAWILKHCHKDQPDIPGMNRVLKSLKKQGYLLFLLSNANDPFYNYALQNKNFFRFFSGTTISADLKLLKPQREIYDRFCQIHALDPAECLFIDDQMRNVQAAQKAGWQAYQFMGTDDLKAFLEDRLGIQF